MLAQNRPVCIKKMKNRKQFEAEIGGRCVGGTMLSTDDVIGIICWHTPDDGDHVELDDEDHMELDDDHMELDTIQYHIENLPE